MMKLLSELELSEVHGGNVFIVNTGNNVGITGSIYVVDANGNPVSSSISNPLAAQLSNNLTTTTVDSQNLFNGASYSVSADISVASAPGIFTTTIHYYSGAIPQTADAGYSNSGHSFVDPTTGDIYFSSLDYSSSAAKGFASITHEFLHTLDVPDLAGISGDLMDFGNIATNGSIDATLTTLDIFLATHANFDHSLTAAIEGLNLIAGDQTSPISAPNGTFADLYGSTNNVPQVLVISPNASFVQEPLSSLTVTPPPASETVEVDILPPPDLSNITPVETLTSWLVYFTPTQDTESVLSDFNSEFSASYSPSDSAAFDADQGDAFAQQQEFNNQGGQLELEPS